MDNRRLLRWLIDPAAMMRDSGAEPDPYQCEVLRETPQPGFRGLLLSCRQAGKSTVLASLALWWALFRPRYDCLILSPTQRQASEIIQKIRVLCQVLGVPLSADAATKVVVAGSGGRVIALAASGSIRGMTGGLILVDEGAFVPDSAIQAGVLPMLSAVPGGGSFLSATTPFGPRGWFHAWWVSDSDRYRRWKVDWTTVPRITQEYHDEYKARVPRFVYASELLVEFAESGGGIYAPELIEAMFVKREEFPFFMPKPAPAPWDRTETSGAAVSSAPWASALGE
ncbi:terminase large subunit domain-containing protein [Streptomyces sp. NPDC001709]